MSLRVSRRSQQVEDPSLLPETEGNRNRVPDLLQVELVEEEAFPRGTCGDVTLSAVLSYAAPGPVKDLTNL